MYKLRICSLFSGIGGFETGFINAFGRENCKIVFASEIDKFASEGYELLYGDKPFGDVRQIHASDVPDHDILLAGFPCQAFSLAGKKLGLNDARGTLFFEVARIAKEKKPRFIVLENVRGLLSDSDGSTIRTILSILSDIGYKVDINLLNSKFYDVAQSRERVFIVAMRDVKEETWDINGREAAISQLKKDLIGNEDFHTFNFLYPNNSVITKRIKDIMEESVEERYYMKEEVSRQLAEYIREKDLNLDLEVDNNDIKKILDIPKHILNDNERQRRLYSIEGISPTVLARSDTPKILLLGYLDMKAGKQVRSVYDVEGLSPTVDTAQGGHRQIKVLLKPEYQVRKLTPLEVFRLQAFPDEYYHLLRSELNMSPTQLYKMAGNAVTTTVIEAIANQIKEYYY